MGISRAGVIPDLTLTTGETTCDRRLMAVAGAAMVSQRLWLSYFRARKTEAITSLRTITGNVAMAGGATLARLGVYEVNTTTNDLTLVASTASDTALWAATNTAYDKALSATWTKNIGTRYAIGLLAVSAGALATFHGVTGWTGSTAARTEVASQERVVASLSTQADLPASITDASLDAASAAAVPLVYVRMIP